MRAGDRLLDVASQLHHRHATMPPSDTIVARCEHARSAAIERCILDIETYVDRRSAVGHVARRRAWTSPSVYMLSVVRDFARVFATFTQRPLSSRFTSHSPWKPGRRVWPVRSCCMAACLRSRFLAMSRSSPPSSASTSLNAVAMARCSGERRQRNRNCAISAVDVRLSHCASRVCASLRVVAIRSNAAAKCRQIAGRSNFDRSTISG